MIRVFDFLFSFFGILIGIPVFIIIFIVGMFDTGSPLFFQQRVGKNKKPFVLIKFRTMTVDTKDVASHLAPAASVTPLGKFLRKTKLDELPQLWNVLVGDMSLVGPRPCLFNQTELISAREALAVFNVRPGITGLAQVKNIDMSTPDLLAKTDRKMLESLNLSAYFKYIFITVLGGGYGDAIK
ncbi:sugar transferase [Cellvibrio sp. QJXJ]|uniref:sugar transferase n=1 Tax=Cellvibrio sp. QJXJ TaxID=2964606 RepID=UPI0021C422A5|nr:sugar transferase [Cellvibrio sp. QJXJ]UUA71431.1 sugar transferase [Cellvibrio sp. QJXJ]